LPTTRQNAGKLVCPMKVPAGTSSTVIVVFKTGNGIPARLAQLEAAADTQPSAVVASNVPRKVSPKFRLVIAFPPFLR